MRRALAAIALPLALVSSAISWPLSFGEPSGNRVATGQGTFPRLTIPQPLLVRADQLIQ